MIRPRYQKSKTIIFSSSGKRMQGFKLTNRGSFINSLTCWLPTVILSTLDESITEILFISLLTASTTASWSFSFSFMDNKLMYMIFVLYYHMKLKKIIFNPIKNLHSLFKKNSFLFLFLILTLISFFISRENNSQKQFLQNFSRFISLPNCNSFLIAHTKLNLIEKEIYLISHIFRRI